MRVLLLALALLGASSPLVGQQAAPPPAGQAPEGATGTEEAPQEAPQEAPKEAQQDAPQGAAEGAAEPSRDSAAAAAAATVAGSQAAHAHDSPRASLERFLDLARADRYDDAAVYLDLPPERAAEGPLLARRLKAVLDHYIWFELAQVSGEPDGDENDGLPAGIEQIGVIPGGAAVPDPVRLIRVDGPNGATWIFSRATVEATNGWFDELPNRWTLEFLPPVLLRPGFGNLLWWQWLALPLLAIAAWPVGLLLSRVSGMLLNRLAQRSAGTWDDLLIERLHSPLTLAWTLAVLFVLVPVLGLVGPAQALIHTVLRTGLFLVFFWSMLRCVDVLGAFLLQSHWAQHYPASRALVPLGGRVVKAGILAMAVVGVLGEMGFSVHSLIAGLGIGGLALALAAQKTGENLFAAFSIGIDQPFRVGDLVQVEGMQGHVETIGMRSTRIRTLDRTLVTVPNGKLVEMNIETFAVRDRIRFATKIGLVYGTTADQMRQILEGFEAVLRGHPDIWPDTVIVKFTGFGDSSLDIEVLCWFHTTDYNDFRDDRQDVLLGFMDVVAAAGSDFAFPTRTVHLVGGAEQTVSAPLRVPVSAPVSAPGGTRPA
jgi:MscS family membrane protein